MAKIAFGGIVTNARGKLAGSVFTKGKSGPTLRNRVKPRNPRSTEQSLVRANLAEASRVAKAFNSTELANWKTAAAAVTKHNSVSGAAYSPSWMNYFVGLSSNFLLGTPGGSIPTTPPTSAYPGDTITVSAVGASGSITWTGSAQSGSGQQVMFLAQKLKSANRTPNPRGYRVIDVAAIPATPFQVMTSLSPGTYAIGYKFLKTATGQTTLPVFLANVTVS